MKNLKLLIILFTMVLLNFSVVAQEDSVESSSEEVLEEKEALEKKEAFADFSSYQESLVRNPDQESLVRDPDESLDEGLSDEGSPLEGLSQILDEIDESLNLEVAAPTKEANPEDQNKNVKEQWNETSSEDQMRIVSLASLLLDNDDKVDLFFKHSMVTAMDSLNELNEALGFGAPLSHLVAIPAGLVHLFLTFQAIKFSKKGIRGMTPDQRLSNKKVTRQFIQDLESFSNKMEKQMISTVDTYASIRPEIELIDQEITVAHSELEKLQAEQESFRKERGKILKERQNFSKTKVIDETPKSRKKLEATIKKHEEKIRIEKEKLASAKPANTNKIKLKLQELESAKTQFEATRADLSKLDNLDDKAEELFRKDKANLEKMKTLKSKETTLQTEKKNKISQALKQHTQKTKAQLDGLIEELTKVKGTGGFYKLGRFLRGAGLGVVTLGGYSVYAFVVGDMVYFSFDKCDGHFKICPDMDRLREKYQSDVLDAVLPVL